MVSMNGRSSTKSAKTSNPTRSPWRIAAGILEHLTKELGSRAYLRVFEHADHSFHVPVRSGQNDQEVMRDLLDALVAWIDDLI
jgi:hypothetical protein